MKRKLAVSLLVFAVVGVGGWSLLGPESNPAAHPKAEAYSPVVDTGADNAAADGRIVPLRHVELAFQAGGQVAEILVQEWDTVSAGDSLLSLDATDQQIALAGAQAGLAQARANLETAQAGLLAAQTGVTAAALGVTAAEVGLDLVQADPTAEEVALSESSVAAAEAGVAQAAGNRAAALEGATEAEIRAAEAQLAAARAQLEPLQDVLDEYIRSDVSGDARTQTEMQVEAAQASVKAAQAALDELLAGATAAEQQAADGALSAAISQQEAAQARHGLLLAGSKSEQITVAETGVEQARAAVAEAELAVEQAQAGVVQAEAGLAQAEAAVQAARVALDQMTLKASFDGSIADLPVELGQVVGPGMPAVVLADLNGWLVETTDLTELDVAAVAVGASADVELDALPGRVLDGTVTDIASVSSLVRGDVTYVVTVRLDEYRDLPLRWGMTASVDVAATGGATN